eukprot:COSAG01_NODE_1241_length_11085_cov_9.712361_14_plen_69_part_00
MFLILSCHTYDTEQVLSTTTWRSSSMTQDLINITRLIANCGSRFSKLRKFQSSESFRTSRSCRMPPER